MRINPPPDELPKQVEQRSTYDARGFEDGVKARADLVIQMNDLNKAHVIDFTFVEPTSQTYFQAALKGQEQKLKNEYKHWQVISGNNIHVTNNFHKLLQSKLLILCSKMTSILSLVDSYTGKRIAVQLKY